MTCSIRQRVKVSVTMCLYVPLCVTMCLYVSLCVSMCIYVNLLGCFPSSSLTGESPQSWLADLGLIFFFLLLRPNRFNSINYCRRGGGAVG